MFNLVIFSFLAPVFIGTAMAFGDGLFNSTKASLIAVVYLAFYLTLSIFHRRSPNNTFEKPSILVEILAFFVLGPLGVGATYYFQSGEINAAVINSGFALGLFAIGLLSLKCKTNFILSKFLFCILAAPLVPLLIYSFTQDHVKTLWTAVICLLAIPAIQNVSKTVGEEDLLKSFTIVNKLLVLYCAIFSLGWVF